MSNGTKTDPASWPTWIKVGIGSVLTGLMMIVGGAITFGDVRRDASEALEASVELRKVQIGLQQELVRISGRVGAAHQRATDNASDIDGRIRPAIESTTAQLIELKVQADERNRAVQDDLRELKRALAAVAESVAGIEKAIAAGR